MRAWKPVVVAVLALVVALPAAGKDKKKDPEAKPASAQAAATAPAASDVVATVAGQPITKADLDAQLGSRLAQLRQQEYDMRKQVLDQVIQQKLIEAEAAKQNLSLADLLKKEVEDKAVAPTTAEIDQLYERMKPRLGTQTREEAGPELERQLKQQKMAERRMAYVNELKAANQVTIFLDPPRTQVEIPATASSIGPADAPVTVVEFSDYQCPFCKRAEPTVQQLLEAYKDKIRFVYMDYPLAMHPRAMPASKAAACAGEQGKFWEYHKLLMTSNNSLSDEDLKKAAADLGLQAEPFAACYASEKHVEDIQREFEIGMSAGVTGTPSFFVNGRMLVGAKPIDQFKQIIDEEIARASSTKAAK